MKVVIDQAIPSALEYFSVLSDSLNQTFELMPLPSDDIIAANLGDAEVLWVRSTTRVDHSLLGKTAVKFVGSCTIGTDHIDLPYLLARQITFAHAPGCNANAVADYVMATLLRWWVRKHPTTVMPTLGIVGYGHIGRLVEALFYELFGFAAICRVCDPPQQNQMATQQSPKQGWWSLADLLTCDVVTLHVPLTNRSQSPWPTAGLFDKTLLNNFSYHQLLINTSRGDVLQQEALLTALSRSQFDIALDVFPKEPHVSPELITELWQTTPHIAGTSVRGKLQGTEQVFQQFCQWLGVSFQTLKGLPSMDSLVQASFAQSYNDTQFSSDLPAHQTTLLEWSQLFDAVVPLKSVSDEMKRVFSTQNVEQDPRLPAQMFKTLRHAYKPRYERQDIKFVASAIDPRC